MLKVRLLKLGMKGRPTYRIIVIESQRKRGGKPVDLIGYWYPSKETIKISKEKLTIWLHRGAQLTPGSRKLLSI